MWVTRVLSIFSGKNGVSWTERLVRLGTPTAHALFLKPTPHLLCSTSAACRLCISCRSVQKTQGWRFNTSHALSRLHQGHSPVKLAFLLPVFFSSLCDGDDYSHMLVPLPRFLHQHCSHHCLCHISASVNRVKGAHNVSAVKWKESAGPCFENHLFIISSALFYFCISWPGWHCLRYFFKKTWSLLPHLYFYLP